MLSKKTRAISIRLKSLIEISPKCYKAEDWQNNSALIPKSQVFCQDYEVQKSDAWWVAEWFVLKEEFKLMVSIDKRAWYNPATGKIEPNYDTEFEHHIPLALDKSKITHDDSLTRPTNTK